MKLKVKKIVFRIVCRRVIATNVTYQNVFAMVDQLRFKQHQFQQQIREKIQFQQQIQKQFRKRL